MPTTDAAYAARRKRFAEDRTRFKGFYDLFDPEDYQAAVDVLLEMTYLESGTGGAVRAARVLLNAYNGPRFPFDPSDLAYLDDDLRIAAFSVMWGRIATGIEPHELLHTEEDPARGSAIFRALAEDHPPRFEEVPD